MITVTTPSGIVGRVLRRGDEGYEHYRRGTCWHERVPDRYPEAIVSRFVSDEHLARLDAIRAAWDPDHRFVPWLGRPDNIVKGMK